MAYNPSYTNFKADQLGYWIGEREASELLNVSDNSVGRTGYQEEFVANLIVASVVEDARVGLA